ncbi:MAG: CARDB domain-containing protein [Candidatus Omnitrophica bacterium]|nr:CARDB domain-containing protein [Candidatus Omnitrophota bacterium]MDD5652925.1 CARDB domain-containing protein [Candidatus Omnitrophota bacterium]
MKQVRIIFSSLFFLFISLIIAQAQELLPDLQVDSINFTPVPKENGAINSAKISISNQGKADAAACVLGLSCTVKQCNEGKKCDELSRLISADIAVPALKQGEKADLLWQPAAPMLWVSGKYSLIVSIDKYNVVKESDELDNNAQSTTFVQSLSPRASP